MQNFIAQSMRRAGLAPANKGTVSDVSPTRNDATGTEPLAHMNIGSKWSYATLEYPIDIQQRTDLGHYMMFYINVADTPRSKYSTYNSMGDKETSTIKSTHWTESDKTVEVEAKLTPGQRKMRDGQEYSKDGGSDKWKGNTWTPGQTEKVVKRASYQGQVGDRFNIQRTKRTTDSIVLYMPPTITNNTNAAYKSTELGGMAMETAQRVMDTVSKVDAAGGWTSLGGLEAIWDQIPGMLGQGLQEVEKGIAKAVSAVIGGDAFTGLNKMTNRAENRYLEAAFDAVGFRKFSYTFKFTPKSVEESFVARDIIKTFRFHMSPELPEQGDFGRYFITPAEFDLFYMFRGDENTWLNKISTCVLTNMDVNYANGNYQTFRPVWGKGNEGAPPIEIEMKLDFMETKIITKKEILEGY
tara:strand:- start:616 stop:1848 length:1233 start_codon:yes stop_codon:yes gene_type:complete